MYMGLPQTDTGDNHALPRKLLLELCVRVALTHTSHLLTRTINGRLRPAGPSVRPEPSLSDAQLEMVDAGQHAVGMLAARHRGDRDRFDPAALRPVNEDGTD